MLHERTTLEEVERKEHNKQQENTRSPIRRIHPSALGVSKNPYGCDNHPEENNGCTVIASYEYQDGEDDESYPIIEGTYLSPLAY